MPKRLQRVLVVFRVTERSGEPVGPPRPEFSETVPQHADMLRYDQAFHDPKDPSRVIFPIFHSKNGKTGGTVTHDRWKSFGLKVDMLTDGPSEERIASNVGNWITFRHTPGRDLQPVTLNDYMKQEGLKLYSQGM